MQRRIKIRHPGLSDYGATFNAMSQFTRARNENTADEIWYLQHHSVFTLGMAGKEEHILDAGNIPVVKTDRGGQVTYHGPGQLVVYLLFDLQRKGITVKRYVSLIEQSLIDMCASLDIKAERKTGAPGVYVADKKIAALGIRVKRGCSYHGLALNVDMDLSPFRQINPCGYPGLQVTQLKDEGSTLDVNSAFTRLLPYLINNLDYTEVITEQTDAQLLKSSRAA
jgi:lipoyl(octanoyl) transferase